MFGRRLLRSASQRSTRRPRSRPASTRSTSSHPTVVDSVIARLGEHLRILEIDGLRRFDYETFPFDTEQLDAYRAAVRSRPKRRLPRQRENPPPSGEGFSP